MRSRWPIGPSVLVCLVPNAPAAAAEFGNGFGVAGGVSLVSDFPFRGISLSDEDVAVPGTLTFTHDGGFYARTWASSTRSAERRVGHGGCSTVWTGGSPCTYK